MPCPLLTPASGLKGFEGWEVLQGIVFLQPRNASAPGPKLMSKKIALWKLVQFQLLALLNQRSVLVQESV